MEKFFPRENNTGSIGTSDRAWGDGYFEALSVGGVDYTWPAADGTSGQVLKTDGSATLSWTNAGGATAWDDIADPDSAGTIACTTFAQTLTSTKTDGDNFNFQGLGAFGDISVMRIEQKTGNATDGTVLEVVAADANVDPLVVSSSAQAGALVVGQNAGTVAIAAAATVGGTLAVTGAQTLTGLTTCTAGAVLGASKVITTTTNLTSAQVKALKATPIDLTPAPGADYFIQLLGALLVLDYGSNAFTESSDDLIIQYETSGVDACAAITSNGFITATADTIAVAVPTAIAGAASASFNNKKLQLFNSGDGEIAGNAANDSTLTVQVTYAVHALGLA